MSTNRRLRPRVDANQPDIVAALRKKGYSVEPQHDDILVGVAGLNLWFEIKDPEKTLLKSGRIRTTDKVFKDKQIELMRSWQGQYQAVWSLEEIERAIEKHLKKHRGNHDTGNNEKT
jgi:hypothetical protein